MLLYLTTAFPACFFLRPISFYNAPKTQAVKKAVKIMTTRQTGGLNRPYKGQLLVVAP